MQCRGGTVQLQKQAYKLEQVVHAPACKPEVAEQADETAVGQP